MGSQSTNRMLRTAAIAFLFAAATTEARRTLLTPVQGPDGNLPENLPGCDIPSRCVRVKVDVEAVGDDKIDIGGREFDLTTEAEPVDEEHGAITPVDVYQSPDKKNMAYAQVVMEDWHYMLMPEQPGENEARAEANRMMFNRK